MLHWLFSLLQIPFPCFSIVECNDDFMQKIAAASNYYMKSSQQGQMWGLAPAVEAGTAHPSTSRFVTTHAAADAWPLFPHDHLPQQPLRLWQTHCTPVSAVIANAAEGSDIADCGEIAEEVEADMVVDTQQPPMCKQEQVYADKVENMEKAATLLIGSLLSDSEVKEKHFGSCVSKVVRLKVDLLICPFGKLVMRLDRLAKRVTNCKSLLRPLREWLKTGRKVHFDNVGEAMLDNWSFWASSRSWRSAQCSSPPTSHAFSSTHRGL